MNKVNNKETWKDVVGYEGFYKVSDKGNIKSVERLDSIGRRCGGLVLRSGEHKHGYLQVRLYKNGKGRHKLIHRLVSKAFIPNPNSFLEVNHIDENKKNNEAANLEWCDTKYNVNYGTRNKRVSRKLSKKVKAVNVISGEVIRFKSTSEAGKKGYSHGNVSMACRGTFKDGQGSLIGNGHLYRGYEWHYE